MKITESHESFVARCQEDYETEVKKVLNLEYQTASATKLADAIVRVLRVAHYRLVDLEDWMIEKEKEDAKAKNRFADADSIQEVVGQAIGAGSACWHGGTGQAEFDSDAAVALSEEATARIKTLLAQGKL